MNQKINVSLVLSAEKMGFDLVWEDYQPEDDGNPGDAYAPLYGVHAISTFRGKGDPRPPKKYTIWYVWDTFQPGIGYVKDEFPMIDLFDHEMEG